MRQIIDAQQAEYLNLFKTFNSEEQAIVVNTLKNIQSQEDIAPSSKDNLVDALALRNFSHRERVELELESLACYFQRRRALLRDSITASEVARLLETSRQTPHDRVKSQTLLGVLDNGALRFPMWQFDAEGPNGVIDGLPEVLKALHVSDFTKLNWLVRPNPVLDGLTPVEALRQGQKERVIQEAVGINQK